MRTRDEFMAMSDKFDRKARKVGRRPDRDIEDYEDYEEDPIYPDDVPAEV